LLPAPARFSTTTVWLSAFCSGPCSTRASTSEEPAGANGTMIRIGAPEVNCAEAGDAASAASIASAPARRLLRRVVISTINGIRAEQNSIQFRRRITFSCPRLSF